MHIYQFEFWPEDKAVGPSVKVLAFNSDNESKFFALFSKHIQNVIQLSCLFYLCYTIKFNPFVCEAMCQCN